MATDQFLLEEFAPFQLAVVANRVSQAVAKIIERKFNLHIPEWRMMTVLAKYQPCSGLDLVQKTAMDPARVSRAQTRLLDLGLITAVQDPEDRRRLIISLTDNGTDIVRQLVPDAIRTEEYLFGTLTDGERRSFERVLSKLFDQTDALEQSGDEITGMS